MKHVLIIAAAIMVVAASALARAGGTEQQIRDLENEDWQTTLHGGAEVFRERYVADDFLETNHNGVVHTKAEVVAYAKSGAVAFDSITVDDEKVRVYGDTAVVTGRAQVKGATRQGRAVDARVRYTRVWVKQEGTWKVVSFQLTPIAESAPPQAQTRP